MYHVEESSEVTRLVKKSDGEEGKKKKSRKNFEIRINGEATLLSSKVARQTKLFINVIPRETFFPCVSSIRSARLLFPRYNPLY